ncbi:hypothetical protein [Bradyrhizobium arachidis]|uniref:hypothetical protein n=1 Tax=Bradyrhizobium arachidis TaxID=858423 RepID=UPI002161B29D|nr:hypothetical protein [Bradyrhizobium arachidis]UVO31719.1 hypothetical protein KUF59_14415 [Bradyrhizobium arachidis]
MESPSVTDLYFKFLLLMATFPILAAPLIVLTKKNCTAEINVIWYAFSLVLVLWWSLHLAMHFDIVRMPADEGSLSTLRGQVSDLKKKLDNEQGRLGKNRDFGAEQRIEDDLRRVESDLHRRMEEGEPGSARFFYHKGKEYLTDTRAELGLVATLLIVTIAPQLLNYILAGLSGCAAAPRYVWQFEKIAIWSLIKFLAAFGGVLIADGLGIYAMEFKYDDRAMVLYRLNSYLDDFLWGMGAIALAFIVAVIQVYTLEAAQALGNAWPQKPRSWPFRVHRYFTRNLPREESKSGEGTETATFAAQRIWDKLTPDQQQEIGALVVRKLSDQSLVANAVPRSEAVSESPQVASRT